MRDCRGVVNGMGFETACIGFDADDTLWHNERVFKLTQERFAELLGRLALEADVYVLAVGPQTIRLVTHLDVSEAQVGQACAAIAQVAVAQDRAAGPN